MRLSPFSTCLPKDLFKKIFILALFLVVCRGSLLAGIIAVNIDSRPFKTEYIVIMEEVFVPVEPLMEAFKIKISWDPSTLWLKIGDREVPLKGMTFKDIVFVPLKGVAREAGYDIEWDSGKNLLNINTTKKETPGNTKAGVSENQVQEKTKRKEVIIRLFQEDPVMNVLHQCTALRVHAEVINEKIRFVENIEAHCVYKYPDGRVYYDDIVRIPKLAPGESKRVVFFTTNPLEEGRVDYELKVQVEKRKR